MQRISFKETIEAAREHETAGEYKEAESLYLKILTKIPANIESLERLMIIYRKQKLYNKELAIIRKAIKSYLEYAASHTKEMLSENKKAAILSKKLARQLGMIDQRGRPVDDDEIIIKWRRREGVVLKKLGKG